MGLLVVSQPGAVVALADPNDAPLPLAVAGWGGPSAFQSVITELSVERQGNVQFVHTLKDLVYVYAFGERIGRLRIAGLSFAQSCGAAGSGIEAVLNYYEQTRVGNNPAPVTVAVGVSAAGRFRGFLTGLRLDITRPEARIAQFALEFNTLPNSAV